MLSHDEYARYIHQIVEYNRGKGNSYQRFQEELRFDSWIDYILVGDVYILGLGMDFAEFDLWWLLGRRLRENAGCGKIVYYEPIKPDAMAKHQVLRDSGVVVESCGITIQDKSDYTRFYQSALAD